MCGVCEAARSAHGDFFRRWLAAGKHGEMAWLANNVEARLDPRKLLDGARSVICVADEIPPPRRDDLARYAQVRDYHKVIKKRLHAMADALGQRWPDERFRACVDTAPIMEREHAARGGLGWIGKHTLLLNRERGSHLLLGQIVTTLAIATDEPAGEHCGTCTRCIDACPTDAITPWSVDATKCISYLTIEHRGDIDEQYHRPMSQWLFGCDVCQDVCPYVNKAGRADGSDTPPPGNDRLDVDFDFDALDVLDWTEDDRRAAFRGSAMKRAKLAMMKRNAVIVAGNRLRQTADERIRARLEGLAADEREPAMVRRTARRALAAVGVG